MGQQHEDDAVYREYDHREVINDLDVEVDNDRGGVALLSSACPTCKARTTQERRMGYLGGTGGTRTLRPDASIPEKPLRDYFTCRCGFVHKKGDEIELGCGTTWDATVKTT